MEHEPCRPPPRHRCIWCKLEKAEDQFNVEHVMPQSFGTFEKNLTLINSVCEACNSFFARELEPCLPRDSLEGFDRYRYGQKAPSEFKSQGVRSISRIQLTEGPFAGAWGFTAPGDERLMVRPFPQIGFATVPEGPFEWFPLDGLPTLDELKAKGYSGSCHVRLCECSSEECSSLLAKNGIAVTLTDTFAPPSGGTWVEEVHRPTINHRRGLAKIALNYVACQYGVSIALEPRFDHIRALVMESREPGHKYYDVDEHPIVDGDKQSGERHFGHAIVVRQRPDGSVEAIVSLFNRFRHGFMLAKEAGSALPPRGSFFDIGNRVIREMSPTGATKKLVKRVSE